ncbi:GLYL3 protein, partial [Urocolius indicus]|nr:GLYL3 protein [Urocolius indicus]
MLILRSSAQLQRLEEILRSSLPFALPVYGAVMNINRGNPGEFEVVVDSWPNFRAVLARRSGEVAGWSCRSPSTTPTCTLTPAPCPSPGEPQTSATFPHLHHPPSPPTSNLPPSLPSLPPGLQVGTVSPSLVDLLNETWPYGGNPRSRRYLAEVLSLYPNICLRDEAGEPLSWALSDHFGSGTHAYTLPSHRRRGYMRLLINLAARRAKTRGFPSFG